MEDVESKTLNAVYWRGRLGGDREEETGELKLGVRPASGRGRGERRDRNERRAAALARGRQGAGSRRHIGGTEGTKGDQRGEG